MAKGKKAESLNKTLASAGKKEISFAVPLNATMPVRRKKPAGKADQSLNKSKLNSTVSHTARPYEIIDHIKYIDAFKTRKEIKFASKESDRTATKHSKYVYRLRWKSDNSETWELEEDIPSKSMLNAYKLEKRLPDRHEVVYRVFRWDDAAEVTSILTAKGRRRRQAKDVVEISMNENEDPSRSEGESVSVSQIEDVARDAVRTTHVKRIRNVSRATIRTRTAQYEDNQGATVPSISSNSVSSTSMKIREDLMRMEDIEFISLLGEGSQAKVYQAEHKLSGKKFAVKTFKNSSLQEAIDESVILRSIKHENVIRLICQSTLSGDHVQVLECGSKTLYQEIEEEHRTFDVASVAKFADEMFHALSYIHDNFGMHRDVKPENILRVGEKYKLMDFGVFCKDSTSTSNLGTHGYMAPEMDGKTEYNCKVDVYAMGVVVVEMLSGRLANSENTIDEMLTELVTVGQRDFCALLIEENPLFRLSAKGARHHPFVTEKGDTSDWKVCKLKVQRSSRLKDSTVMYRSNETVGYVRHRLDTMWNVRDIENMKMVLTTRQSAQNDIVRLARLCDERQWMNVEMADFSIRITYQRVSARFERATDSDSTNVFPARVKFTQWGTIPKLVMLVNNMKVEVILEILLDDFDICGERNEYRLYYLHKRSNSVQAEEVRILPGSRLRADHFSNQVLILRKSEKSADKSHMNVTQM